MKFLDSVAHDLPGLFTEAGRAVDYTPAGGSTVELTALVGERSELIETELGVTMDGTRVWARFVASDVPAIAQDDTVTIDTAAYVIDGVEPDRGGTVLVTLKKAGT